MDVQSRTAVLVVMTAGMRHGLVVVALSLASVQAGARGLTQQSVVDSAVACTACRLDVSSPIRLRGVVDGGLPNTAAVVQRAADGTLYVVYDGEYSSIVAHRADGVFAGQRFGRRGGGPAEYSRIKHAVLTADTIRAFDYLLSRRTDINRVSGALIRTVPFPDHARLIVLADGRTVLGGSIRSRSTAGQPLHIFDSTGKWQRSWGVNNPALHPGLGPLLSRRMAPVAGTTFWAAPVNEYRLELWNADGALLRSLVAPRAWFPRWTE